MRPIRVGATLEKVKGVRDVVFDTTAVGFLKMRKGAKPDRKAIEKALPRGIGIKKLEEQDVPVAVAKWELTVTGVG